MLQVLLRYEKVFLEPNVSNSLPLNFKNAIINIIVLLFINNLFYLDFVVNFSFAPNTHFRGATTRLLQACR